MPTTTTAALWSRTSAEIRMMDMSTLRAIVENGRVSVEVDYPDGTEVTVKLEETHDPFANMPADERARLHAVLDESEKQFAAGLGIPAEEVIRRLRARR